MEDKRENNALRMADLPFSERPMEKMETKGVEALSDADLLAVLLRSGKPGNNALSMAYRILAGSPDEGKTALGGLSGREFLREADVTEFSAFSGIGKVKAHQIVAAIELGKRVSRAPLTEKPVLNSPERVWSYLKDDMGNLAQEEMRVLLLDVKNRLIRMEVVSRGGLSSMVIQPREIMRLAVRANAAALILVHNHPSGDPKPSQQDRESTEKLKAAGHLIGIPLHDHVIVCKEAYYSLCRDNRF